MAEQMAMARRIAAAHNFKMFGSEQIASDLRAGYHADAHGEPMHPSEVRAALQPKDTDNDRAD